MSARSTTEFVNGVAVITDHVSCDKCGTVLDVVWNPPESMINKALAAAGWFGNLFCNYCPECAKTLPVEDVVDETAAEA